MSLLPLPVVQDPFDDAHEFLCARCARRQDSCCVGTDIVLTTGDIERVAVHVGRRDFVEFRPAGKPEYLDQDDDPLWRDATFLPDGTRRVVRHRENRECSFLGPAGCVLPGDVRPLICRLYPFEYDESGLKDELATGCPSHLLPEGVGLIETLGMDRVAAERWRETLYDELRTELAARDAP